MKSTYHTPCLDTNCLKMYIELLVEQCQPVYISSAGGVFVSNALAWKSEKRPERV